QPLCTITSSPTLTFFTSAPTAHTMPEQSLPPAWKSSGSPSFCRSAMTSRGWPSAAHRLAGVLPLRDEVQGWAERGPHVVVVDARRHDVDQHLVGPDGWGGQDLAFPCVLRRAEAALSHREGVHALRHFAERGPVAQL